MHPRIRGLLLLIFTLALPGGAGPGTVIWAQEAGEQQQPQQKPPPQPKAEEEAAQAPEMLTKVFKLAFNFNELSYLGEPSPDPSQPPPADPFAESPAPEKPLIKTSRQILEETGVTFPAGASALFDPVTRELTLHNTPEMLELAQSLLDLLMDHGRAPTLAFTLTIVEGPGRLIREANAAASRNADATPQLEALLAAAAKPDSGVRVVAETFIEAQSGTRATVEAVQEYSQVVGFKKQAATETSTSPPTGAAANQEPQIPWIRQDGLRLELESFLGTDGKTLETTLALDLGPATTAEEKTMAAGENGTPGVTSARPAEGLRKAHFATRISSTSGSTRLIGITKPTCAGTGKASAPASDKEAGKDEENTDTLWAVFLSGQAHRVGPPPSAVPVPGLPQEKLAAGQRAAAFQVPEGLLESLIPEPGMFAPKQPSLQAWLATQGVALPGGASLAHRDGLLQVVSTPEDIEIIAALVERAWAKAQRTTALTLRTFQVPAALLRPLIRQGTGTPLAQANDAALLAAVEAAVTRGEATPIDSAFFEVQSGERATHESGPRHSYLEEFGTAGTTDPTRLTFQEATGGSYLEIEPMVSADGRTLRLTYQHELQPTLPTLRRQHLRSGDALKSHDLPATDFHMLRTTSITAMASGGTRLISLHSPALPGQGGHADVLWATFLQAHVVPQVRKQTPPRKEIQQRQPLTKEEADKARITEKMNKIIIPEVSFNGVSLEQAVEFLRVKSRELDTFTEGDGEKGVNFILPPDDIPSDAPITLDLKDVPLSEALRYVTELSMKRYTVKAHGVLVIHHHYDAGYKLQTRSFSVPPDFMSLGGDDIPPADPFAPAPPPAPVDPFVAPLPVDDSKAGGVKARKTAKQILEAQGITFPEGSSARYIPAISMLVVRNTRPNLDLVEVFCSPLTCGPRPGNTVAITAQVLQGPGPLLRRIAAQAAPLNDHRALLDELLAAVNEGTVQVLDTARIETMPGNQATAEQGHDATRLTGITLHEGTSGGKDATQGDNEHGGIISAELESEARPIGLRLEAGPTIMADGFLVSLFLTAEYHIAPPLTRSEHLLGTDGRRLDFPLTEPRLAKLTTEIILPSGHARLLHLWQPGGRPEFEKEEVLQVMFITCDVLHSGE